MTASRSAREKKAASEAGPLARVRIDLDGHNQFVYKISCSACVVRGRRGWSAYRPGGDNGFMAAMDRWVFHLTEKHPGTDAPCLAFLSAARQRLHERRETQEAESVPARAADVGPFFHGTKADLEPGDVLEPGYGSNFGEHLRANYIYLTATLDAATWGAELALGEGPGRIYRVEPTGPCEDDPDLTDQRFPGNPTRSYRTREPLRVIAEVSDWEPHSPEVLQEMRDHLDEGRGGCPSVTSAPDAARPRDVPSPTKPRR